MKQLQQLPKAYNSQQSQKFGRRVYLLENGDHKSWLKLQLKDCNAEYQHGFLNELKVYTLLQHTALTEHSVLGNFLMIHPYEYFQCDENVLSEALWLDDLPMLFAEDPNQLGDVELFSKNFLLLSRHKAWQLSEAINAKLLLTSST